MTDGDSDEEPVVVAYGEETIEKSSEPISVERIEMSGHEVEQISVKKVEQISSVEEVSEKDYQLQKTINQKKRQAKRNNKAERKVSPSPRQLLKPNPSSQ